MSDDPNLYLEKLICCKCGCTLQWSDADFCPEFGMHVYREWSDGGRVVTDYYCMPCWWK